MAEDKSLRGLKALYHSVKGTYKDDHELVEFIQCGNCGAYTDPFYFTDRMPFNPKKMQDCTVCGNIIKYNVNNLGKMENSLVQELRKKGKWVDNEAVAGLEELVER